MYRVENLVLGMCGTNCYFVFKDAFTVPRPAIIIDPAADFYSIRDTVIKYDLEPKAILLTHGHFDHILVADHVRNNYGIKIYASEAEKEILNSNVKNLSSAFTGEAFTLEADEYFKDGESLLIDDFEVKTMSVPGHTIGGTCYYFEKDKLLFSGDTLFTGSVGRSDFPTGSASALVRGIREKLMVLPDDVKVYPGHGEPTTIGYERENNPFI